MEINTEKKNCVLGRFALVLTTLIWGTSFVILKKTLDEVPTLYVLAYRFTGATILLLLIGMKDLKKIDLQYIKGGMIMGVFLFLAYTIQTYGLFHTTPGKNAFLTTTYCVLTPFIYWAVVKKKPDICNYIAAVICMAGVGFVSLDGDLGVNIGDILTLCSGMFFALHIVATSKHIRGRSVRALTMIQFATASVLCWIFALLTDPVPTQISTESMWSILYLSVMCTAVCFIFQTYGQKYTPPSTTAVIMTLESVFGTIISVIFYHEQLSPKVLMGFALIFIAVLISETKLGFLWRKRAEK
ncbi:MAG: DMT family transporter [Clostridiales bacterium]|nr:DMT family transporter [Clostridiales bacterium]